MEIVEILKTLADENRLRILNLLLNKELCVCNIEEALGLTQSNASRHLTKLRNTGFIYSQKDAQWVHHYFNKEIFVKYPFLESFFNDTLKGVKFNEDIKKLVNMESCDKIIKASDNK